VEAANRYEYEEPDFSDVQVEVYCNVQRRGYFDGRVPRDIVKQQVLKAVEELGEVARHVFDGEMPPVSELADVVIPMFIIAHEIERDLLTEVRRKSAADVRRGVRGAVRLVEPDNA